MRKMGVDWLYVRLSKKQNCYRARLTPKPYRMKHQTIKIKVLSIAQRKITMSGISHIHGSRKTSVSLN